MNAFELFNENQKPTGIWCCGECRRLVLSPKPQSTREAAEACCRPPVCETCNKQFQRSAYDSSGRCSECRNLAWSNERAERLAKFIAAAVDVTESYDGPIYVEGDCGGDMGEGYYSTVDAYRDRWDDDDEAAEWGFACKSRVEKLCIDDAIERLCDDGYEDMADHMTIPQSLKDAVAEFNAVNASALTIYETDYKRKVRLR